MHACMFFLGVVLGWTDGKSEPTIDGIAFFFISSEWSGSTGSSLLNCTGKILEYCSVD